MAFGANIAQKTSGNNNISSNGDVRVMVVDDSVVIRGLISRTLEAEDGITVVASVGNGKIAVSEMERGRNIEVVVLDVEMPVMDGLEALPLLLKSDPNLQVVMASTLTMRNAKISMRAMQEGAADYVPKPTSNREVSGNSDFKTELIAKVKTFGQRYRSLGGRIAAKPATTAAKPNITKPTNAFTKTQKPNTTAKPSTIATATTTAAKPKSLYDKEVKLRKPPIIFKPQAIAIGSSTGGPQALFEVISSLGTIKQPIFITQHMPATFTAILAQHISSQCKVNCTEAVDGEVVKNEHIYLAPGDYHMRINNEGGKMVIKLSQDDPVNFCRPAVDPLLQSLSKAYKDKLLTVILTGMGADGRNGCKDVVKAGGVVLAQDEESSVVWGMPGAVATAGLASELLPLKEIGNNIKKIAACL